MRSRKVLFCAITLLIFAGNWCGADQVSEDSEPTSPPDEYYEAVGRLFSRESLTVPEHLGEAGPAIHLMKRADAAALESDPENAARLLRQISLRPIILLKENHCDADTYISEVFPIMLQFQAVSRNVARELVTNALDSPVESESLAYGWLLDIDRFAQRLATASACPGLANCDPTNFTTSFAIWIMVADARVTLLERMGRQEEAAELKASITQACDLFKEKIGKPLMEFSTASVILIDLGISSQTIMDDMCKQYNEVMSEWMPEFSKVVGWY